MSKLSFKIKLKAPLHIGGTEAGLVDQPTYKLGGAPVVPASSIKGAARHLLEEAIRREVERRAGLSGRELAAKIKCLLEDAMRELGLSVPSAFWPDELFEPYAYYPVVCDPLSHLHCNPPTSVLDVPDDTAETFRLVASLILLRRVGEDKLYCPACSLFGGNGHPSPLVFKNARAEGAQVGLVTRVSIDRLTGAAKQERLFTAEYVAPGAEFVGEVEFDGSGIYTPEVVRQRWREYAAAALRAIRQLGKFKSVGFGEVEVEVDGAGGPTLEEVARELVDEWCRGDSAQLARRLFEFAARRGRAVDVEKYVEVVERYAEEVKRLVCCHA